MLFLVSEISRLCNHNGRLCIINSCRKETIKNHQSKEEVPWQKVPSDYSYKWKQEKD